MTFLSLLSSDLPHPLSPPSTYRRVQKPALSAPLHTFGRSNQAKPESCVLPSWLQDISEEGKKKKKKKGRQSVLAGICSWKQAKTWEALLQQLHLHCSSCVSAWILPVLQSRNPHRGMPVLLLSLALLLEWDWNCCCFHFQTSLSLQILWRQTACKRYLWNEQSKSFSR